MSSIEIDCFRWIQQIKQCTSNRAFGEWRVYQIKEYFDKINKFNEAEKKDYIEQSLIGILDKLCFINQDNTLIIVCNLIVEYTNDYSYIQENLTIDLLKKFFDVLYNLLSDRSLKNKFYDFMITLNSIIENNQQQLKQKLEIRDEEDYINFLDSIDHIILVLSVSHFVNTNNY